jgi:hypothetical protein
MPRELVINTDLDAVFCIGAAIKILRIKRFALGVGDEIVEQKLKLLRREPAVFLPPHVFFRLRVGDDKLVLGAATGVDAGLRAERTTLYQLAFAVGDGVLDQNSVG